MADARRGVKKGAGGPSSPLWCLTYGDMITNVLCFFVMLFAFARFDSAKLEQVAASASTSFQMAPSILSNQGNYRNLVVGGQGLLNFPGSRHKAEMPRVVQRVKRLLQTAPLTDRIEVAIENQNVKIRIPTGVLFNSGQATLQAGSERLLDAISPMFTQIPNEIRVEGHSDDVPLRSANFPSNWELSSARACTVIRYYIDNFNVPPTRFSAQGFASFKPLDNTMTEAAREKNRRVEITILTSLQQKQSNRFRWGE